MTNLTDRSFWKAYWEKKNLIYPVSDKIKFATQLKKLTENINAKSFIEIGGFPGYYAIIAKKYLQIQEVELFDFYIDASLVQQLLQVNDVLENDIKLIEGDLFSHSFSRTYDIVFSAGFIEHFEDLEQVISYHWNLVSPGGGLLMTVPNFLGANGWAQFIWNRKNYHAHNLKAMHSNRIQRIAKKLGAIDFESGYTGRHFIHMDNYDELSSVGKKILGIYRHFFAIVNYRIGYQPIVAPSIYYMMRKPL